MTLDEHSELEYQKVEDFSSEYWDETNEEPDVNLNSDEVDLTQKKIDRFYNDLSNDINVSYCGCCRNLTTKYEYEEPLLKGFCKECVSFITYNGYC